LRFIFSLALLPADRFNAMTSPVSCHPALRTLCGAALCGCCFEPRRASP
jgi:hypothetical protein